MQRLVDGVMRGIAWDFCTVYIDDCLIFSRGNFDPHLEHMRQVFQRLADANHKLEKMQEEAVKRELPEDQAHGYRPVDSSDELSCTAAAAAAVEGGVYDEVNGGSNGVTAVDDGGELNNDATENGCAMVPAQGVGTGGLGKYVQ